MTAPVTGPFATNAYLNQVSPGGIAYRAFDMDRSWFRQSTPYDIPLGFSFRQRRLSAVEHRSLEGPPFTDQYAPDVGNNVPASIGEDANLTNLVRQKFQKGIGESVQLGVAFAEGRQAMQMMTARLLQLGAFTRHLAKGRFGDAAKAIGLERAPKGVRNPPRRTTPRERLRTFASNYLEFHFGWSPLIGDIYEAAEVLSNPITPHKVRARGKISRILTQGPWPTYQDSVNTYRRPELTDGFTQTIEWRAEVLVSNPNLALAQQCGLVNPLTIAWELVPFSFVLDYFLNVGDFLDQFTEFAGLTLINPNRTVFTRYTGVYNEYVSEQIGTPSYRRHVKMHKREGIYVTRIVGAFPSTTIRLREPWTLSPRRGLAAASLLMQAFPRHEPDPLEAIRALRRKQTPFRGAFPKLYWHN